MYSIYVTKRPTEMDHFLLFLSIPPNIFRQTPMAYGPNDVEIPKKSTMVYEKLILSPKPSSTIPSLELRRLPIQHALYRIPCCPTCDFPRRYASNKNTGKAGLKPEKKKRLATPDRFQPRFSQETPTVWAQFLSATRRPAKLLFGRYTLAFRRQLWWKFMSPRRNLYASVEKWDILTAGDDFFPQPEAVSNMVWWKSSHLVWWFSH